MKICFIASSGGHLEEISQLTKIEKKFSSYLITEKVEGVKSKFTNQVYYIHQINRHGILFLFRFIRCFYESWKIFHKEKPDFIISTGALCAFPTCIIAKIFHKKIIYIESFARIDSPSLTGKLVYKFADLFIVQWKENLKFYPKAYYGGAIF